MQPFLRIIAEGDTLTREQAGEAMHVMLDGRAEPEEMAALLMGLRSRGETLDELVGFTEVMRAFAVDVECSDPHAIDLCGTGGDGSGTFNISTAASFVCAGAGVTVAKHGNRSVSSKCGSADVLEALGVQVELRKRGVEHCLREVDLAFIFAPYFHPALRHVMPVRRKLAVRTFFNILGPLCNPAGVRRQLVGAFSVPVAQIMAGILSELDAAHVLSVHSEDGMDEISLAAPTRAFEYHAREGKPEAPPSPHGIDIEPERHSIGRAPLGRIQGGTAEDNAAILRRIFDGQKGPHRDVVVLNATYALLTSGRFRDVEECQAAAQESIDSGRARRKLELLVEASNDAPTD